jgi:hypothetical protein
MPDLHRAGANSLPWHRFAPMAQTNSLLWSRRFAPLFWCQFFSAFSDNFLKNLAGLPDPVPDRRAGLGGADHARRGGVHRAVLLPVRRRRRDGRPLRQGDRGAASEAGRDRRRAARGFGLRLHSVPLLFARCSACSAHQRAVRPDQVRHPARPAATLRTAIRQRAGRRRDLHGDPARHHRRRAGRTGTAATRRRSPADAGVRVVCWIAALHPARRFGRARPRINPNIAARPVA